VQEGGLVGHVHVRCRNPNKKALGFGKSGPVGSAQFSLEDDFDRYNVSGTKQVFSVMKRWKFHVLNDEAQWRLEEIGGCRTLQ